MIESLDYIGKRLKLYTGRLLTTKIAKQYLLQATSVRKPNTLQRFDNTNDFNELWTTFMKAL